MEPNVAMRVVDGDPADCAGGAADADFAAGAGRFADARDCCLRFFTATSRETSSSYQGLSIDSYTEDAGIAVPVSESRVCPPRAQWRVQVSLFFGENPAKRPKQEFESAQRKRFVASRIILRQLRTCSREVREHVCAFGAIRHSSAQTRRIGNRLCPNNGYTLSLNFAPIPQTSLWPVGSRKSNESKLLANLSLRQYSVVDPAETAPASAVGLPLMLH
jgi:hypothetical protein